MGDFILLEGDCAKFERLLAERFPEVAARIDDIERGILHLEMEVLARATLQAIDAGDVPQFQSHLNFIDELLSSSGAGELENAIYVSYLESVFLGQEDERYKQARRMLSPRLEAALSELEEHWRKIAESANQRPSA